MTTSKLEKLLTWVLGLSLMSLAVVLGYRELTKYRLSTRPAPSPQYVANWASFLAVGTTIGSRDAPIKVITFTDLQCPVCRRHQRDLNEMRRLFGDSLSLTYVQYPLSYHPHAEAAARGAICARQTGAFEPFVNEVYARQDSLGAIAWESIAAAAGISDLERFRKCLTDSASLKQVLADVAAANTIKIQGTPTVLINGWRYRSAPRALLMEQLIRKLLSDSARAMRELNAVGMPLSAAEEQVVDGIRILKFPRDAEQLAPHFEIDPVPQAQLGRGRSDGEFDLTKVDNAISLSSGRIITFAPTASRVLVFDSAGRGVRELARRGRGPGELQSFYRAAQVGGDTVVLVDLGNRRVSLFTADRFVRSIRIEDAGALRSAQSAGAFPDGTVILHDAGLLPHKDTRKRFRSLAPVFSLGADGIVREITKLPDITVEQRETRYGGRVSSTFVPMQLSPRARLVVRDTLIISTPSDSFYLEFRNRSGDIVARLSLDDPRRPVDRSMRALNQAQQIEQLSELGYRLVDSVESFRLRRELPYADSLGAIEQLYLAPSGMLWVVRAIAPGDSVWSAVAIDASLRIAAHVRSRVAGTPIGFGDGSVLLKSVDDDGVVLIRKHRLKPAAYDIP